MELIYASPVESNSGTTFSCSRMASSRRDANCCFPASNPFTLVTLHGEARSLNETSQFACSNESTTRLRTHLSRTVTFLSAPPLRRWSCFDRGHRRWNFVWYRNVDKGATFDELMTDRDGSPHSVSLRPSRVQDRAMCANSRNSPPLRCRTRSPLSSQSPNIRSSRRL